MPSLITAQLEAEWTEFWQRYPRKKGKLAARVAWDKARLKASNAEILEGVEGLISEQRTKELTPHPTTFLNQGRWMDEFESIDPAFNQPDCPHEPGCLTFTHCEIRRKTGKPGLLWSGEADVGRTLRASREREP